MPPLAAMATQSGAATAALSVRSIRTRRRPDAAGAIKENNETIRRSKLRQSVKWGTVATYDDDLQYYSDQEWHATWHSRSELNEYRAACLYTVELMENGLEIHEENGLCLRGLEGFTIEGRNRREKNKSVSRHMVLKTQDLQSKTKMISNDPNFLAKTYQKACADAVRRAYAQALIDHQLVEAMRRCSKPHKFVVRATPIVAVLLRKLDLQRNLCGNGYDTSRTSSSCTSSSSRRQKQSGCVTRPSTKLKMMPPHAPRRQQPKTAVPELAPESRFSSSMTIVPELAPSSTDVTSLTSRMSGRNLVAGKRNRSKRGLLRRIWY